MGHSHESPRRTSPARPARRFARRDGLWGRFARSVRDADRWPWLAGFATSAALVGPGLGPGSLLSLDLVFTPEIPFPDAALGVGGDFPRRVPLGVLLAALGWLTSGPFAGKLLLVLSIASAFAGAASLARRCGPVPRIAAGLLYAAGPFAATRIGAGHWTLLAALAVLPWALPRLLAPSDAPRRTFLWLAALAVTGVTGAVFGVVTVASGLVFERREARRPLLVGAAALVAQIPWLVPALLLQREGAVLAGSEEFATRAEGPLGSLGSTLAQHGFWRAPSQVGGNAGLGAVAVGLGLLVLAASGHRFLPATMRRPLALLAGVGLLVAAGSGLPGLDAVHRELTAFQAFAPLRESQRVLPLFLVWLAPAAALGVERLARPDRLLRLLAPGVFLLASLSLAWPGLWGVDGRLEPVDFPPSWADARALVRESPGGTVLALPWHQYLDLGFVGPRRVLNPLPDYLDADVISSHDPGFDGDLRESLDPREAAARLAADRYARGRAASELLARLGVRWVVLLHEVDWQPIAVALTEDAGLRRALVSEHLEVHEVRAWTRSDPPRVDWHPPVALTAHAAWIALVAATLWGSRGRPVRRERPPPARPRDGGPRGASTDRP